MGDDAAYICTEKGVSEYLLSCKLARRPMLCQKHAEANIHVETFVATNHFESVSAVLTNFCRNKELLPSTRPGIHLSPLPLPVPNRHSMGRSLRRRSRSHDPSRLRLCSNSLPAIIATCVNTHVLSCRTSTWQATAGTIWASRWR